jgi:outer membrane protein insertion porin family
LPGKVLSPFLLSECKRKIKELYKEDGYLLATIEIEMKDNEKENVKDLAINIDENKRIRIENISFKGNEAFEDKKLLKSYYRSHGYRDVEILSDTITYSENKKRMNIEIEVREGR